MDKAFCVYMLANRRNGTLYTGVTSNLVQRAWKHREGVQNGFSKEHAVKLLVWYEQHETAYSAITREKADQKMESCLEDRNDRSWKSILEGFVQ